MSQTGTAKDKWAQRGWRTEQKYSNKVLLGNWAEERLQFTREPQAASGRVDHRPYWDFQPDVSERGSAPLRAEGLPSKLLFGHNGPPSSHHLVTHYEESYQREHTDARPRPPNSSTRRLGWSERPISALTTSGAGPPQSARRPRLEKQPSLLPSLTVYRSAYQRHPLSGFCQSRFARAPRALSSHLHAANHINRDLDLRGRSLLQVPDHCWSPLPRSRQA
ncbi:uncharacterized protein C1orf158 homolog [Cyclopterus lumpus]|uniref:uncharacterized protein C1orf158 homolog n=1 Tax=Cyclopterus lumpus TaxID=8103 RepID=UPI00148682CC|nr:uncharacterized protein C1orf158 homolog [Cyclopterus lumpus]